MIFVTHGLVLALAWFLIVNAVLSVALACAGGALARRFASRIPRGADVPLLALRLLPAAVAFLFVMLAFAPSYILLEPRTPGEEINAGLVLLATVTAALIAGSLRRGWSAWRTTAAAADRLERVGVPLGELAGTAAFAIPVDQPALVLVGTWRPRLLVTRGLLELLSPAELGAAIRHEAGHRRALDNLKRVAVRGVPDLWSWTGAARAVEQAWAAAAEREADRTAVRDSRADALALASAIVKVAKRTTTAPLLPCASHLVDGPDVAARVHALLGEDDAASAPGVRRGVLFAIAVAVMLAYSPAIALVHEASELLVRLL